MLLSSPKGKGKDCHLTEDSCTPSVGFGTQYKQTHTQLSLSKAPGYWPSFRVVSVLWSVRMKKNKSTLITLLCYAYTTTWTYSCWDHWGVPGSAQLQGARPRKTDPAMCREAAGTQTSRTKGCQLLFPLQICIPNTWDTASSKVGFKHMFKYPITNKTCLETKDSLDMKQFQLPSNKPHSLGHQVLPSPPSSWTQTGTL